MDKPQQADSLLPVIEKGSPGAEKATSTDGPVVEWRRRLVSEVGRWSQDGLVVDERLRTARSDWKTAAGGGARHTGSGADVEARGPGRVGERTVSGN